MSFPCRLFYVPNEMLRRGAYYDVKGRAVSSGISAKLNFSENRAADGS
jgi:hypothetical protein